MKNQIFYHRFKDNDGKIAIGQAKFIELHAFVQQIHFKNDGSFDTAKICGGKVVLAPSMEVVDLWYNWEKIKIYPTFEDALNETHAILVNAGGRSYLQGRENFAPFCLQDVWDTLDERLDLQEQNDMSYQPIGYTWNGVEAKETCANDIVFDILNCQCLPCSKLDGYYYSKEACIADNPVKCYTF